MKEMNLARKIIFFLLFIIINLINIFFHRFMASASNFILNALTQASSYLICPWVNK